MHNNRCSGFTLVELIIVIGILSIMASIIVTVIDPSYKLKKARDTERIVNISAIKRAIESYTTLKQTSPNCDELGTCPTNFALTGSDFVSTLLIDNQFLKSIPQPPESSNFLCPYQILLYPSSQRYYNLRWCYESWNQTTVDNLTGNGTKYSCTWNADSEIATCLTGTSYEIPKP